MADDEDLLVTISGPALSMLLYENTRVSDQIGFLIGDVLVFVTNQVTDSDRVVENVKQHINIKSVVAYPIGPPFFDTFGNIDESLLLRFLQNNMEKVVGWYHYIADFRLNPSFRDKSLHSKLTKIFSSKNSSLCNENFIFCRLNSQANASEGTHKFKHVLMRQKGNSLIPIEMKITNLGADASRPDGSDYKLSPQIRSYESDAFDVVYQRIQDKLEKTSGVESVTLIQKAAEKLLEELIPAVNETDKIVSELEQRLQVIRNLHFSKNFDKLNQVNMSSPMQVDYIETRQRRGKSPSRKQSKPLILEESPPMYSKESRTSPQDFLNSPEDNSTRGTGSKKIELAKVFDNPAGNHGGKGRGQNRVTSSFFND